MFIKKYWIPLAVFLVAIAGVGIYYLATQPPPEPIVTYTPVEPLAKPPEKPKTESPVVQETPEAQQGGHTHADGTWHDGAQEQVAAAQAPQTTPAPPADDAGDLAPRPGSFLAKYLSQFSPAEAKRAMSAWFEKAGVPPPPRGYEYIWDDAWVVKRDANGEPVINKIGEPYIQVHTITAFAPNPEQARRYKELRMQRRGLHAAGKFAELEEIRAEMYRIVDAAQGPYPLVTAAASGRAARSRVAQRSREAFDQALVDFGLGHLIGTGIGGKVPRPRPLND